jgi:hypothetical protein
LSSFHFYESGFRNVSRKTGVIVCVHTTAFLGISRVHVTSTGASPVNNLNIFITSLFVFLRVVKLLQFYSWFSRNGLEIWESLSKIKNTSSAGRLQIISLSPKAKFAILGVHFWKRREKSKRCENTFSNI